MFNIGFSEFVVVLLVAFLVVGPKDLPKVARWIARQMKAIRKMICEIKENIGWDEVKSEFEEAKSDMENTFTVADVTSELKDVERVVQQSFGGIKNEIEENRKR